MQFIFNKSLAKKVSYVIKLSRRKFYINAYFTVKECKMRFVANNNLILKWCKDIMIFDGLDILQLLVRYFCLIYEGGEVMDIKSMGIKTHEESIFCTFFEGNNIFIEHSSLFICAYNRFAIISCLYKLK